ncbi:MAG: PKD domain-containing protein [Lacibacter sp.]
MRKLLTVLVAIVFLNPHLFAQDFSNKGKEFWVAYGSHVSMYNGSGVPNTVTGGSQQMVLYFTSDKNATVTVTIPATGWAKTYSIIANQVTSSDTIPKTGLFDARVVSEGKSDKGIHITSDVPVIAYAHIYNGSVSGASLLFPVNTLAREYYSINFTQTSNEANSYSYCYVIATEDNTAVEIIPSVNTFNNAKGDTIRVTLNRGEIYNIFGRQLGTALNGALYLGEDLTGTRVRSVATATSSCKKIAVFSGSGKINIQCAANVSGSADNYIQQAFPSNAWGKKYLTAPTNKMPNNFFRVCVSDPATVVKRNGITLTGLINNFYYEYRSSTADLIESDKPVMVAQYITTRAQCSNTAFYYGTENLGDPEMIYLSPIEQTIERVTINSTGKALIREHWLNLIIRSAGTTSLRIDGVAPSATAVTHPQDPSYKYYHIPLSQGSHTITSDSGFNAIAYGYGSAETYGYNAGTNVKDLYQYVTTTNQYATINSPVACKSSPFIFSITLPYVPLSMKWKIPNYPDFVNNGPVVPDSSFVVNGRTIYMYRLPSSYVYNTIGTYPIQVTVNNPTADGCSGEQVIDFDLQVYDPPVTDFSWPAALCTDSTIQITTNNTTGGRPIIKHFWDFGDGTYAYTNNPGKIYTTPGTYKIRYAVLTDAGCLSDTTEKTITVSKTPVARFGFTAPQCKDKQITFSDSSTLAGGVGTITNWNWNLAVGSPISNTSNVNVTGTYPAAQVYNPTLQVVTSTGCASPVYTFPLTVHPNPVPDFTMSYACLPDGVVNFTNTSAIADGSQALFTHLWNFGDPATGGLNISAINNPSHKYSTTGPYNIKLIVTSNNGCIDSVTKAQGNIYPQPKAGFTSVAEICWKAPVTFTDASNGITHPVTAWQWRFINSSGTVVGTSTNQHPVFNFPLPGTYTVQHWVFTNQGCVSDTAVNSIIIHPWPAADFIAANPLCEKNQVTFTDNSVANVGTDVRWYWNLGDGTIVNASNNNPVTHTYTNWGDKTVKLLVENSKGCLSDTLTRTVHINPLPKIGYVLPEVCLSDANALFADTTRIADNSEALMTYLWNFNTGIPAITPAPVPLTSTGKNPVIHFSKADNYLLSLIVTSKDGCKDSVTGIPFTVNGSIPKADFTLLPTNGVCSNQDVQIKDNSTVDFGSVTRVEIYWDNLNAPTVFDTDDTPAPGKVYAHRYPNFQMPLTRTFQVRYRAYSGIVCVNDAVKTITVNASPLTQFLAMPGICHDAVPRQITQATETGGLPGTGVFTGPGVSTTGMFNPATAGVGVHTIRYTFTAASGCTHYSEQTIEVWPRPVAKFGTLLPSCEKNAVVFSDSSVANSASLVTWNWNFGDGSPVVSLSSNTTIQHTYAAYGTYNSILQVINNRGCTSVPVTVAVKVNPLPRVDFSLPTVCLPAGTAAFTDLSTIPDGTQSQFTYNWNFGDGYASPAGSDRSTIKDPVYKYSQLGPYTVKLVVTSSNNCVDSLTKQLVDVFPQPKASFTSVDSICIGETIDFTDESDGIVRSLNKWHWEFGNGYTSAVQHPSYLYPSAGVYNVQLYVYTTEGCVSDTASKTINVWAYPVVSAGPDLNVLEDGIRKIVDAVATGSGLQFLWTPSTYLDNTSLLNPTIIQPKDDITYTLTVVGRGGCTSADDVFVKVLKMPKPPNTFTPNGDGINDFWEISHLNDYPGCIVEVYNTAGTLVYRSVGYSTPWDGKWKGQQLPAGTYYYVIDPKNGRGRSAGYVTILR